MRSLLNGFMTAAILAAHQLTTGKPATWQECLVVVIASVVSFYLGMEAGLDR